MSTESLIAELAEHDCSELFDIDYPIDPWKQLLADVIWISVRDAMRIARTESQKSLKEIGVEFLLDEGSADDPFAIEWLCENVGFQRLSELREMVLHQDRKQWKRLRKQILKGRGRVMDHDD